LGDRDDQKTEVRPVSPAIAQKGREDRAPAQFGYVRLAGGGTAARARNSLFQAATLIRPPGVTARLATHRHRVSRRARMSILDAHSTEAQRRETPGSMATMPSKPFALPPLPYREDALEPVISARTVAIHHGKHHKTYVDTLNELVAGTPFEHQ